MSSTIATGRLPLPAAGAAEARTWVVNQRHPRASDKAAGTESAPLRTISQAAVLARSPGAAR
jgi:hypothetical protein